MVAVNNWVADDLQYAYRADDSCVGLEMLTSDWAIGVWVKFTTSGVAQYVIAKGGTGTLTGYYMLLNSSGTVSAKLTIGASNVYITTTTTLESGVWSHVVVSYDRDGNLSVKINGADGGGASSIAAISGEVNATQAMCVGAPSTNGSLHLNSPIQDLSVFNALLTDDEIAFIYNGGNRRGWEHWGIPGTDGAGLRSKCVGHWKSEGTTTQEGPANLMANGGFEAGNTTSWVVGGSGSVAVNGDIKRSGSYAMRLTSSAGGAAHQAYQLATVIPGSTYRLRVWSYGDGTNTGRLTVWNGSASVQIGSNVTLPAAAEWHETYVDVTAPGGCTSLGFIIYSPLASSAYMVFDDASIVSYMPNILDSTANGNHLALAANPKISPRVYGAELLTNGGFETVTSAGPPANFGTWVENAGDGNVEVETTLKHGGTNAVKFTAGASGDAFANIYPSVTAGTTYRLALWTAGDGTNAGRYAIWDNSNSANILATASTDVTANSYALVTYDFTAPTGCSQLRITVRCPSTNGAIAYFDDVSLKAVSTAAVLNGGFEDWTTSTNAASWTESVAGTSTVTREDTVVYSGTNAAALNVDGSNSNAQVNQNVLTAGKSYTHSFYARAASGTPTMRCEHGSTTQSASYTLSTSFALCTGTVTADGVGFGLRRTTAASNTIYIDSVSLYASSLTTTTGVDGAVAPVSASPQLATSGLGLAMAL